MDVIISSYEAVRAAFGNDRLFVAFLFSLAHTVPVAFFQSFLMFIGHMKLFQECLSQPNAPTDPELSKKCWFHATIAHFLVMPFFLWLIYPYLVDSYTLGVDTVPDFVTMCKHLLVCIVVEDFFFYWGHRTLHHPLLYKRFHKKHHEFKTLSNMCIAAEYTHPVETVLGNVIPVLLGPMIVCPHLLVGSLWVVIRMLKTCDAHSGYAFAWSPFGLCMPLNPAERHDFHHEKGLGSYGSFFLIWDTVCRTDQDYLEFKKTKSLQKSK
jgi:methylsterol monooxygenase/4-alpha-methyl-delta7-sterol-4alpha-methyl oxidase